MRTVKILAGLVGGVIILAVGALLAAWLLVRPNDYKAKIATVVTESTGRELIVAGDIKLSMFPWVALEFGPASLGNPPGFGDEPFLSIQHATLRVKLMSLLAKRLEIDRVDVDGVDLRLRKNAEGRGNWEGFGPEQTTATGDGKTGDGDKDTGSPKTRGHLPPLEGLRVTRGRVSYPGVVVDKFDLQVGQMGGQDATPINLNLAGNRGVPGETLTLNAKFDLSAEPDNKHLRLGAVNFSGLMSRPGDGSPVHYELSAPALELDPAEQTVAIPAFSFSYANAHLAGKLQATKILGDLGVTGSVTLAPLVLREFVPRVALLLPHTRDPRAFAQLSGSGTFAYGADGVHWDPLQLTLDDTHFKGSLARVGEPRAWKFELAADQIDLERYLPGESGATQSGTAETSGNATQARGTSNLPEAEGTLTVASLHFAPLDFSNVRLTLSSKDGVAHLFPAQAQIDGGSYSGNITVDDRGAVPELSMDEHLNGVDMARLLAGTSNKGRITGHGTVNVKATAHGAALDEALRSLNGHFDANLADGAVERVDLGYEIGLARALIDHEPVPPHSNPPRTKFNAFKMSAEINNGVAKTTDLTVSSTALRVTGQGSANLVNKGINFQMLASLLKSSGASLVDIPLKITGTYVDPNVRPDVDALAKGQLKQKLQDLLQKNGLGGLFGK
jgi:AsmA protein